MSFTKSTKFFIMGLLGAFLVGGVGAIGRLWEIALYEVGAIEEDL